VNQKLSADQGGVLEALQTVTDYHRLVILPERFGNLIQFSRNFREIPR
jgi:hypothetical protein